MAQMRAPARPSSDVLLALAAMAGLQLDLWLLHDASGSRGVTVICALLYGGALAWRRRRPLNMAVVAALLIAAQGSVDGELTTMLTAAVVGMLVTFSAGLHLPRREAGLAALLMLVALWADLLLNRASEYPLASDLAFTSVFVVAGPWLAGRALRERRERTDELERLAERLAEEREQRARVAVLDERARIARDMHDVVAHSVSLMVIQAGAARRVLDDDPEASRSAMHSVEEAGRQALGELRRAVGLLRDGPEAADLTPQPGTAQIAALIDRARASGLTVDLRVEGDPRPLPPGLDLAVYRVVQEALTNTLKHASPARARVQLCWHPSALQIAVSDDGRGPTAGVPSGHGLIGMHERIAVYGGTMHAGAGPTGGWTVRVRIPLDEARSEVLR